jgi:hypothetical protein
MHHNHELLRWERDSRLSYAQMPLLDWVFCINMRSPMKELDSLSQYM